MLTLLAIVYLLGSTIYLVRRRQSKEGEWGLGQWLTLGAAGFAVAVLGWAMFIPADPYYTPSIYGSTNRVNALAGFGLAIAVYAAIGIGVTMAAFLLPRARRAIPIVTILLGLALGAAYVHVVERHSGIWDASADAQRRGMDRIEHAFPELPPGATVVATNYPANQTLGVPIFAATWDLNGMTKMEYEDGSLSAFPLTAGLRILCEPDGIVMRGTEEAPPPAAMLYGNVRLLNLESGDHAAPANRRQCEAVVGRYAPGSAYVSYAY